MIDPQTGDILAKRTNSDRYKSVRGRQCGGMTQPSRRAIFSWRALTASGSGGRFADKSNGPPVVAQKPIEAGSTNIEIVMATSNTQECIVVALFYPSNRIPEHRRASQGQPVGDRWHTFGDLTK